MYKTLILFIIWDCETKLGKCSRVFNGTQQIISGDTSLALHHVLRWRGKHIFSFLLNSNFNNAPFSIWCMHSLKKQYASHWVFNGILYLLSFTVYTTNPYGVTGYAEWCLFYETASVFKPWPLQTIRMVRAICRVL